MFATSQAQNLECISGEINANNPICTPLTPKTSFASFTLGGVLQGDGAISLNNFSISNATLLNELVGRSFELAYLQGLQACLLLSISLGDCFVVYLNLQMINLSRFASCIITFFR